MGKQAIGTVAINQYSRFDGLLYTMVYPHKPMVKTRTLDIVNFDNIPAGQNACIAVMAYSGYDIEDAVILNKASIDRGFGRCMVLKKQQTSVRRYQNGTMDRTCAAPDPSVFPDGEKDKRFARFKAVDKDGLCNVGELLENGTVIVNKECECCAVPSSFLVAFRLLIYGTISYQRLPTRARLLKGSNSRPTSIRACHIGRARRHTSIGS